MSPIDDAFKPRPSSPALSESFLALRFRAPGLGVFCEEAEETCGAHPPATAAAARECSRSALLPCFCRDP